MSFDMAFFSSKQGASASEVRAAYLSACNGEKIDWPESKDFTDFFTALESKFPSINNYSDDDVDDCPWSCEFDRGAGYAIVCMSPGKAGAVMDYLWELLIMDGYAVIRYDPQADQACLGEDELPAASEPVVVKKWWEFWK